jgi:hypothetical protein
VCDPFGQSVSRYVVLFIEFPIKAILLRRKIKVIPPDAEILRGTRGNQGKWLARRRFRGARCDPCRDLR